MSEAEIVTWEDVAAEMARTVERGVDDPMVVDAVNALRGTKLRPSFVLDEWRAVKETQ